jgi:two-component system, response regulator PdtaR
MKSSCYRLAIADGDAQVRSELTASLTRSGHDIVICAADGQSLVAGCLRTAPDLVIAEMHLIDMDGVTAAMLIRKYHEAPFVFSSANYDETSIEQAGSCHAYSYLLKPIRAEEVDPIVCLAVAQHRELIALRSAVTVARQQLADRKVIERAKGILMARKSLSEQEAFSLLKQVARNERKQMVMVARSLLLAEGLLKFAR